MLNGRRYAIGRFSAQIAREDLELAHRISYDAETGDPNLDSICRTEIERAWQQLDRFVTDKKSLESLIRLSRVTGATIPAGFSPVGGVDFLFGPQVGPRRTRILCTVGPVAEGAPNPFVAMIKAGMDGSRMNFSHINTDVEREEARRRVALLRGAMKETGRTIPIIADLQGPKLRMGAMGAPVQVKVGDKVTFYLDGERKPAPEALPVGHPDIIRALAVGHTIYVDDGKVKLVVREKKADSVTAEVLSGGPIGPRKGINLPDSVIQEKVPTKKDCLDIEFVRTLGVDAVMVSFVETADDIARVREQVGPNIKIIAKIERKRALENLEAIARACDGLLIARGDGAVEIGDDQMPVVQAKINALGNALCVPTGVATQMMESMMTSPRPSRADASDVYRAFAEGAEWVMTSAETAQRQNPEEVITAMAKILQTAEASQTGPRFGTSPTLVAKHSGKLPKDSTARSTAEVLDLTRLTFGVKDGGDASGPKVRCASAIVPFRDGWLIVPDDSHVCAYSTKSEIVPFDVRTGERGEPNSMPKAAKPDFECATTLTVGREKVTVLFGSGSTSARMHAAVISSPNARPTVVDISCLYKAAMKALNVDATTLNIEGACEVNGVVRFFQRGNGKGGVNASFDVDSERLADALASKLELSALHITNVRRYDLGKLGGVALGFSDATALPDGRILFSASAESGESTYEDGETSGSVIGLLDAKQKFVARWKVPIPGLKLEGLALDSLDHDRVMLVGVTDSDDATKASELLSLRIRLPNVRTHG